MTIRNKKPLALGLAVAGIGVLSVTAVAYACTTFEGTFSVAGSGTSATVTSTGTGMMTQTVSTSQATTAKNALSAVVKVSTGLDGSGVGLPSGTYDINFYNSGPQGINPGYTDHNTWNTDCMTRTPLSGTKLGTVTVGGSGTLTGQSGGSGPVGGVVTYNNAPAPNSDTGTQESAVCISNSAGSIGNEAPITVI